MPDVRVVWTHEDQVARTVEVLRERGLLGARRVGLNLMSYHLRPRFAFELRDALGRRRRSSTSPPRSTTCGWSRVPRRSSTCAAPRTSPTSACSAGIEAIAHRRQRL